MEVSSPACGFSGRVDEDPFRSANEPDQLPFGECLPAPDTGPLGNVPDAFIRFPSHSGFLSIFYYSQSPQASPRLCFLRTITRSRSGS